MPTISILGQLLANDEFETSEQQKTHGEKKLPFFKMS